MKTFIKNWKFSVAKDDMGFNITELQKLREAKNNVNDAELRKKLDEKIKEEEEAYVEKVLSTDIMAENKKDKERSCEETLEVVDAIASTIKKLVKWAYKRH